MYFGSGEANVARLRPNGPSNGCGLGGSGFGEQVLQLVANNPNDMSTSDRAEHGCNSVIGAFSSQNPAFLTL